MEVGIVIPLARLRQLAETAHGGAWVNESRGVIQDARDSCVILDDQDNLEDDDAAFIVAANPQTVLELVGLIEQAQRIIENYVSQEEDEALSAYAADLEAPDWAAARAWLASVSGAAITGGTDE